MVDLLLDATELASIRADVLRMLPDTGIIENPATTYDGKGHGSVVWTAPTGGTVSCRLDMERAYRKVDGKLEMIEQLMITLPHDAPVDSNSRITVNSLKYYPRGLVEQRSWQISNRFQVERRDT